MTNKCRGWTTTRLIGAGCAGVYRPRRLGLRAEKCASGDGLTMAAPARVVRAPVPNQLGRRAIRGPVANQRLRGLEHLRCIFRADAARSYEDGGCQTPRLFSSFRHTFTEAVGAGPSPS